MSLRDCHKLAIKVVAPRLFGWFVPKHYADGITPWPFILLRFDHPVLDNHERIHWVQWVELFVVGFLAVYVSTYLWGLAKHRNHRDAYLSIPLEREAYKHQANLAYLKTRRWYAWARS